MELKKFVPIIEAVLFAGGEAVSIERICLTTGLLKEDVLKIADILDEKYARDDSGIELLRLGKSLQLATKKDYSDYIKSALEIKRNAVLSPAALEALTIIAYNQPVTKSFVENVRGVDSSGVINSLVEKGLLMEAGRLDLPGRPIAYKTTDVFLRAFHLSSLSELPPIPIDNGQLTVDNGQLTMNGF